MRHTPTIRTARAYTSPMRQQGRLGLSPSPQPPVQCVRPLKNGGYTLVELVVSSASAAILMTGLASALFVAGQALNGRSVASERARAADAQAMLLVDLEHAISFGERQSDKATFTVPDRDGDGNEETLTYAWTGSSGGELTLSINGGPRATVLTGVENFALAWFSRFMQKDDPEPPALNPDQWGNRW